MKQLIEENYIDEWKLFTCIYNMTVENTPKIKAVLNDNQLTFFPETHCYLKFAENIYDFTFKEDISNTYQKFIVKEFEIGVKDIQNSENINRYFEHLSTLKEGE